MNLIITYPRVFILGLITAVLIIVFWYRQKKTILPEFQFTTFLPQTTTPKLYIRLYRACLVLIVTCCFFVLSFPKRTQSKTTVLKSGIDIVIALDVSYSMEANDLTPNRLDAAKHALQNFLSTRSSDRIGLVVFAGKPFTSIPLTFDYQIFDEILDRITTTTINQNYQHLQGTAIGDALLNSIALLEKETADAESGRERIIVLFTDGEANVGVDPVVVAQLAAEKNIKLYTIGIGSIQGGIIQTPTAFGMRQQQVSGVDETTLRAIATQTDGIYARAIDDSSLTEIINQIATLTRTEAQTEQYTVFTDARGPFLRALLISMLMIVWIDRKLVV